jgi:hypothetical protein
MRSWLGSGNVACEFSAAHIFSSRLFATHPPCGILWYVGCYPTRTPQLVGIDGFSPQISIVDVQISAPEAILLISLHSSPNDGEENVGESTGCVVFKGLPLLDLQGTTVIYNNNANSVSLLTHLTSKSFRPSTCVGSITLFSVFRLHNSHFL